MRIAFSFLLLLIPVLSFAGVSVSGPSGGTVQISWREYVPSDHSFAYLHVQEKKHGSAYWNRIVESNSLSGSTSRTPGAGTHFYRVTVYTYAPGTYGPSPYSTSPSASVTVPISGPEFEPGSFNIKPLVHISNIEAGDALVLAQEQRITVGATDVDGAITRVDIFENDSYLGEAVQTASGYVLSGWSPSSLGFARISAVAYDDAGEHSVASVSVKVDQETPPLNTAGGDPLQLSKYDIYYGDIDQDGKDGDIYFYGKDQFILLHGDIAIPLVLPGPPSFVYSALSDNAYSDAWQLDVAKQQLQGFSRATVGEDVIYGDLNGDGNDDIIVRGASVGHSTLVVDGTTGSALPAKIATVDVAGRVQTDAGSSGEPIFHHNLSDRGVTLSVASGNLLVDGASYLLDQPAGTFQSTTASAAGDAAESLAPSYVFPDLDSNGQQAMDQTGAPVGEFSVSETGAANYSFPFTIASGTAGVAPEVALFYNSQSGRGSAGIGWSLSAGGAISRCRQTKLVDGQGRPISWTDADRFCLNGQRLLVQDGFDYGAPGAIYKTQLDSFVTVESHGPDAGHPDYFTVTAKDGSTSWYGAPEVHNSEWQGRDANGAKVANRVMTWGLQRFQDNVGNYMLYEYIQSDVQYQLETIKYGYGKSSGVAQYSARVVFEYDVLQDQGVKYAAGYRFQDNSLLTKVSSYTTVDDTEVSLREYHLRYNEGTANYSGDDASRLTSVNECVANVCLPPLWFGWGYAEAPHEFYQSERLDLKNGGLGYFTHTFADINGDGRLDLVWLSQNSETQFLFDYAIQSVDGAYVNQNFLPSGAKIYLTDGATYDKGSAFQIRPLDINADGRTDIALYRREIGGWELYISSPYDEGQWRLKKVAFEFGFSNKDANFADLNGDGLVDAYYKQGNVVVRHFLQRDPSKSIDSPMLYSFDSASMASGDIALDTPGDVSPGDFNSDGNIDFIGFKKTDVNEVFVERKSIPASPGYVDIYDCHYVDQLTASLVDGASQQLREVVIDSVDRKLGNTRCSSSLPDSYSDLQFNDINGDGVVDVAYRVAGKSEMRYALGKGDGAFLTPVVVTTATQIKSISVMDYDGDGDADIYFHDGQNEVIKLATWTGSGYELSSGNLSYAPKGRSVQFMDVTGDGVRDRVTVENSELAMSAGRDTHKRNQIVSFNSGRSAQTTIEYEVLSHSSHYQRVEGISVETSTSNELVYDRQGQPIAMSTKVDRVVDSSEFYRKMNAPFADVEDGIHLNLLPKAPILEMMSPMAIVTSVSSSSPSYSAAEDSVKQDTRAAVSYYYSEAKLQAGGQGFLGFKSLTTVDLQTGGNTTTTYRQDWPFVGSPLKTQAFSSAGYLLSESITEVALVGMTTEGSTTAPTHVDSKAAQAIEHGNEVLGPLQPYVKRAVDKTYKLLDNGQSDGSQQLVSESETVTGEPDIYGNVMSSTTVLNDGAADFFSKQTTISEYFDSNNSVFDLAQGRLAKTTVTSERRGEAAQVRVAEFNYYGNGGGCSGDSDLTGMLCSESIRVDDPAANDSLTTYHYYDEFGNEVFTKSVADAGTRLSALAVYDEHGRYVEETYGMFSAATGSGVSVPNGDYALAASSMSDAVIQKTSQILQRDKHGVALAAISFVGVNNYVTSRKAVTPFGNSYFVADGQGGFERTRASLDVSNCPVGSDYSVSKNTAGGGYSAVCMDQLGREVRAIKKGFTGELIYVDKQYDILSRVVRVSEPYSANDPIYWSEMEYDILGRPIRTLLPFNKVQRTSGNSDMASLGTDTGVQAVSTITYDGLSKTITDTDGRTKLEVTNVAGEVISIGENGGRSASYKYDVQGNLREMTDAANNVTVINYDALGRKQSMSDPDKGTWVYKYNGFGNQICQKDTNGQTIATVYDFNGRTVQRQDREGGSCPLPSGEAVADTSWQYDTAPNGLGKLDYERDSISQFARFYSYDELGRSSVVTTEMKGFNNELERHFQKNTYDQYGRPHEAFDAARVKNEFAQNGTRNIYNSYGYLQKLVNAANTGEVYYQVTAMDARGNVTQHKLASGVVNVNNDFNGQTGFVEQISATAGAATLQSHSMKWDHLGNLIYRAEASFGTGEERFEYDQYNQLTGYHFVKNGQVVTGSPISVGYDNMGNITSKSDVGAYTYNSPGSNSVRPHAVASAGGHSYSYDSNGNMVTDTIGSSVDRRFDYTAFDKVARVTKAGALITDFDYGTDRSRYRRVDNNLKTTKSTTTLYIGSVEKIYHHDQTIEWKRTIGGVAVITQVVNSEGDKQSETKRYLLKDHLGSISHIVDEYGMTVDRMAFDPWGQRRQLDSPSPAAGSVLASYAKDAKPVTSRGFTGHEMVDGAGIIHMNGRIYDARLARFLQADPIVQEPAMVGSLNRYSYTMNNPLNAIDPSGFSWLSKTWGKAWDKAKPFVGMMVATVLTVFAPAGAGFWYATFVGAFAGAAGAAANGTSILKGALVGGISAAAFYGVGQAFSGAQGGGDFMGSGLRGGVYAAKVVAHGVTGGIMSKLQGGKFAHGFASAGLAQAFAGKIDGIDRGTRFSAGRITAAAMLGGTGSKLTGGKFANGAMTGAFSRAFNDEMHARKEHSYAITEKQREMAAAGDREGFWKSRWEDSNDPMGKIGLKAVNNKGGIIDYLFGGQAINNRLQAFARVYGSGPLDVDEVGIKLMNAHVVATDADRLGMHGLLSPRQIAIYHHDVFADYALPSTTFGGTPMTGGLWEASATRAVWCGGCD